MRKTEQQQTANIPTLGCKHADALPTRSDVHGVGEVCVLFHLCSTVNCTSKPTGTSIRQQSYTFSSENQFIKCSDNLGASFILFQGILLLKVKICTYICDIWVYIFMISDIYFTSWSIKLMQINYSHNILNETFWQMSLLILLDSSHNFLLIIIKSIF